MKKIFIMTMVFAIGLLVSVEGVDAFYHLGSGSPSGSDPSSESPSFEFGSEEDVLPAPDMDGERDGRDSFAGGVPVPPGGPGDGGGGEGGGLSCVKD